MSRTLAGNHSIGLCEKKMDTSFTVIIKQNICKCEFKNEMKVIDMHLHIQVACSFLQYRLFIILSDSDILENRNEGRIVNTMVIF